MMMMNLLRDTTMVLIMGTNGVNHKKIESGTCSETKGSVTLCLLSSLVP